MKKMFSSLILSLALLSGCVASTVKETVERNVERVDKMVLLMEEDKTTRDQEQAFIRALRPAFHSLNYYLNDKDLPSDLLWLLDENQSGSGGAE